MLPPPCRLLLKEAPEVWAFFDQWLTISIGIPSSQTWANKETCLYNRDVLVNIIFKYINIFTVDKTKTCLSFLKQCSLKNRGPTFWWPQFFWFFLGCDSSPCLTKKHAIACVYQHGAMVAASNLPIFSGHRLQFSSVCMLFGFPPTLTPVQNQSLENSLHHRNGMAMCSDLFDFPQITLILKGWKTPWVEACGLGKQHDFFKGVMFWSQFPAF